MKLFHFGRYKSKKNNSQYKLLKSSYFSLLFISLFVSLNGSLTIVTLRSIIFLYMGGILSLMNSIRVRSSKQHSFIN